MATVISTATGTPKIKPGVFLAPNCTVVGDVTLDEGVSIWFNAVIRGDVMPIVIGKNSNIQDGSIIHGTYKKCGTTIGENVSIGHAVLLHGCEVGDFTLVGMGSIIMDQAKIGKRSIVGAGSLITENANFPDGVLILGRPAKVVRELKPEELEFLPQSAKNYLHYQTWYENMKEPSK